MMKLYSIYLKDIVAEESNFNHDKVKNVQYQEKKNLKNIENLTKTGGFKENVSFSYLLIPLSMLSSEKAISL